MRIAICHNPRIKRHSGSWINPWSDFCEKNTIDYEIIDGFDSNIIEKLKHFDVLLWHFSGFSLPDMKFARSVIYSAKKMGLAVFPDFNEAWHFDDKIAETYLLQSVDAPIPDSKLFYSFNDLQKYSDTHAEYPVVAKLRNGSGSHNVKLLKNKNDLLKYAKKMFSKGLKSTPDLIFKTKSNLSTAKNFTTFKNRLLRSPEFIRILLRGRKFDREQGYVFFQEFIPNDGFDLKVVVVGDKLSIIGRNTRKNDFRASGGGDLFYDHTMISGDLVNDIFEVNDKLGFQCMGYDIVINTLTKKPVIVEISYGFSNEALLSAGGYFNRNGIWVEEPLNAPFEIIKNINRQNNNNH